MLALAVAPAVALAIADGVRRYAIESERLEQAVMSSEVIAARRERDAFVGLRAALMALAASPAARDWGQPGCDAAMRAFVDAFPGYSLAVVIDRAGAVRCASPDTAPDVSFADDPNLRAFFSNPEFMIVQRDAGRIAGEHVLVALTPIRRGEEVIGAATASIPADAIGFLMGGDGPTAVDDMRRAVVSGDGEVMLTEPGEAAAVWLPSPALVEERLAGAPVIFDADSLEGTRRLYVTSPLLDGEAWMIAGVPAEGFYDSLLARAAAPIGTPLLMLVIAVAVAYFALDRLVARHLVYLARITRAYGAGRLGLRPKEFPNAPREIAILGVDLAEMAGNLEARQQELKDAAESNRLLLLEVYHRVKNNLQMIVSLLNLQGRRARSDLEREALDRIRSRVESLSLVHEKLYAAERLNRVPLDDVIADIARRACPPAPEGGPRLNLDLARIDESAGRATPIALFVNEAMSNAARHATRLDDRATISLSMVRGEDGGFIIEIANDAAVNGAPSEGGALGLRLMEGFARQIGGEMTRRQEDGRYVVRLSAPPPPREDHA